MATVKFFILCFLAALVIVEVESEFACKDLREAIVCTEAHAAGNCYEHPWNGICRKTCGRCEECYDASNFITCEDELEKGNCGDEEVAHFCSQTCQLCTK